MEPLRSCGSLWKFVVIVIVIVISLLRLCAILLYRAAGALWWMAYAVTMNCSRTAHRYLVDSFLQCCLRHGHVPEGNWEMVHSAAGTYIVHPDSEIYWLWQCVVSLAVIYNMWLTIVRITYKEMSDQGPHGWVFFIADSVTDLIYLLDISVSRRTAYLKHGLLVSDVSRIARRYRSGVYFYLDLASLFPVATISRLVTERWTTPLPYGRLLRTMKMYSMWRFFGLTDSRTNFPNIIRAAKLMLYLALVMNWIACLYYLISEAEGQGSNDWVYPSIAGNQTFTSKYIRCMHWALITLTTIGGAANPVTDIEFLFTGVTYMLGLFVFAAVVGNVGNVISNMNAARQDFQTKMDALKFYMNRRGVPEELQNRVKRWSNYAWTRNHGMDDAGCLEILPPRMRAEVAIQVHLETLRKVRIFEDCEEGVLCELVLKLKPQIFSPGDFICKTGEIGREMYIINHGVVEVSVKCASTDERTVVATLQEGNYFGEISLLELHSSQKRTADVRSVGYSELLVLSRKDLMSALVEYPKTREVLEAFAEERILNVLEKS
ncbi:PREDICTED: cyclic nucleotide-gated channel rod photoreceptor subunit alpha-like [Priapulus caudatus]|uniref:Cyclic nucleotide-gated channel rod photoreceptor subunit alpha-like n=1 Tax=Priapulus caudatus TaxID=37621 RepID=A0ABM1EQS0_PRICU|nr:PREDICTED: cyclic nucleotide-gated channel rod photoreceptor subunit alpha-like [Priapulus caudatus]